MSEEMVRSARCKGRVLLQNTTWRVTAGAGTTRWDYSIRVIYTCAVKSEADADVASLYLKKQKKRRPGAHAQLPPTCSPLGLRLTPYSNHELRPPLKP